MTYLEQLKEELSIDQYLLVEIVMQDAKIEGLIEAIEITSRK